MGKVVQGIIGVAAIIGGVLTGNVALITTGIGMTASSLKSTPKPVGTGLTSRVSIDPNIKQWLVIGETALPTQLIYFGTSGLENKNLSMVFVHSCHPLNALTSLALNNVTTSFPTPSGAYGGILAIQTALGGQTSNPFTTVHGGEWNSAHIGRDLAMSHFRWAYDADKLASGLPQNIQFVGQGIAVYDPRRDSTRGGSGSMRADNQATWAYSVSGDAIGRNPALVELTYRLGWKKNGRLWAGMGEDPANFDYAAYIAAANVCDESVGGQPRYRIDGLLALGDNHNTNLGKIHGTCAGKPVDVGGLIGFWAANDDTATAVMTLNDSDWIGDIGWQPLPEGEVRNTARGTFIDPLSYYQERDYAEVAPSDLRTLDNGEELADSLDFMLVQSEAQCRRLASIRLRESRQGRFVAPTSLKALGLRPTQVVALDRPRMGWSGKRFRVETMGLAIDRVQLVLREIQSSDYTDISTGSGSAPASLPTLGYIPVVNGTAALYVPATTVVKADFTGAVLSGQLPRIVRVYRYRGDADVSATTTWSVAGTGCSATIDAFGGISITAVTTTGKIVVTSDRDGVTLSAEFAVIKETAPPPVTGSGGGGTGGTSASDSSIASISSSSYSGVQGGPLTVKAGTGGIVDLSAALTFSHGAGGSVSTLGKWQWRVVGGSYADVTTEIASTDPALSGEPNSGYIEVTMQKTGLTSGADYEFQLLLRRSSGSGTVTFAGTAAAVGS